MFLMVGVLVILLTLAFAVVIVVAVHKASKYLEELNDEDIAKRS